MRRLTLLLGILSLVTACMNIPLDRHPSSGYSGYKGESYGEVSLSEISKRDLLNKNNGVATRNPSSQAIKSVDAQKEIDMIIENNDIFLGMEMSEVQESWGVPDQIYVAGDERHKNQIWKYSFPIQTSQDYKIEERIVKFENGKVVGWQGR